MFAAPARSWSSRTIPRCANCSSSSSRTKAIARHSARRRRGAGMVARGTVRPDLILADYNLPNGMNGLQVAAKLREQLHREIPVIILTGDISTGTLRDIARQNCVQLNKPVKLKELTQAIQRLLPLSQSAAPAHAPRPAESQPVRAPPVIFVVDDDSHVRDGDARRARGRWPDRRGLCDLRGISRSLSSGPRSMPADRCLSAGNERARIAAAASRRAAIGCRPS